LEKLEEENAKLKAELLTRFGVNLWNDNDEFFYTGVDSTEKFLMNEKRVRDKYAAFFDKLDKLYKSR
jgi:hypothetical protein